jgi:Asp-tRNA(Asn)/Glu-tRNA(Gln) amidotransferase B subunit
MNTTSAVLDREIHTSTDEIIRAHEQQLQEQQARTTRVRGWLLGTGMSVLVAAAAVAISFLAG